MGSRLADWLPKARDAVRREILPTNAEREEDHQRNLDALARRVETAELKARVAKAENALLKEKQKGASLLPKRPLRQFNVATGAFETFAPTKKKRSSGTFFGL